MEGNVYNNLRLGAGKKDGLMTLRDEVLSGKRTPEDSHNFYHSSASITVECAFDEINSDCTIFLDDVCDNK